MFQTEETIASQFGIYTVTNSEHPKCEVQERKGLEQTPSETS